jgi:hypothetical protein
MTLDAITPLLAAALEVQSFFQKRSWASCVIGGLAVHRWGKPRATDDVDLALWIGSAPEEPFVAEIRENFAARQPEFREFALTGGVIRMRGLLINASNGVPVDIALGAVPFAQPVVRRATAHEVAPGCTLVTMSAEDLVFSKALANRDQDWVDLDGIVLLQNKSLNWEYIGQSLGMVCALTQDQEPASRLAALRAKLAD